MARHVVSADTMVTIVTELRVVTEFVETLILDTRRAAEDVSATWSGDAHAAYLTVHDEWQRGAELLSAGTAAITRRAEIATENYGSVCDHVRRLWG